MQNPNQKPGDTKKDIEIKDKGVSLENGMSDDKCCEKSIRPIR